MTNVRRWDIRLILFGVTLVCCCGVVRATGVWTRVGVAKVDITPSEPVLLAGYGGRTGEHLGVDQRIWARALVLGDNDPIILVAVDNCGVPARVSDQVARTMERQHGIPRARFVVCSTHTHNAPTLTGLAPVVWSGRATEQQERRVDQYTHWLTKKLAEVASSALARRIDARLQWGQGQTRFGGNRRVLAENRWAGFGFQRNGPIDHSVPVMAALNRQGKVVAVWANYACHCTAVGSRNHIGGDWAGCANEEIERAFPGALSLTTIGCGADVGPQPSGNNEIARRHGATLAREVARVLAGPMEELPDQPAASRRQIQLPLTEIPSRAEFMQRASQSDFHGQHAQMMLNTLNQRGAIPRHVPYTMTVWRFGGRLGIVFLAGEVVVDYAVRLKTELDGERLWINGWANDVPSYIPSRRVLREGGYEAEFSQIYYGLPGRYDPAIEDQIFGAVKNLLGPEFASGQGRVAPRQFYLPTGREWFAERVGRWVAEISPAQREGLRGVVPLAAVSQSGFEEITSPDPMVSEWYNYSGRQESRPFIRQLKTGNSLAWRTPILDFRPTRESVVLLFLGGLGWSSEPETEGFELSVNGRATIQFDITRQRARWESADGTLKLHYFPTWSSDVDSGGLFYLTVPTARLVPGEAASLQVTSKGSGSKRWFSIDTLREVASVEKPLLQALREVGK